MEKPTVKQESGVKDNKMRKGIGIEEEGILRARLKGGMSDKTEQQEKRHKGEERWIQKKTEGKKR